MNEIFPIFYRSVIHLPASAILKAVQLHCEMMENDLAQQRIDFSEDVKSSLTLGKFLQAMTGGTFFQKESISLRFINPCREIIAKLVAAQELPYQALETFDAEYAAPLLGAF